MKFCELVQSIALNNPSLALFYSHLTSSRSEFLQLWAVYGMGDETKPEKQIDDLLKMLVIDVSPLLMSKGIRLLIKGR